VSGSKAGGSCGSKVRCSGASPPLTRSINEVESAFIRTSSPVLLFTMEACPTATSAARVGTDWPRLDGVVDTVNGKSDRDPERQLQLDRECPANGILNCLLRFGGACSAATVCCWASHATAKCSTVSRVRTACYGVTAFHCARYAHSLQVASVERRRCCVGLTLCSDCTQSDVAYGLRVLTRSAREVMLASY
jgi:hypothetical protein